MTELVGSVALHISWQPLQVWLARSSWTSLRSSLRSLCLALSSLWVQVRSWIQAFASGVLKRAGRSKASRRYCPQSQPGRSSFFSSSLALAPHTKHPHPAHHSQAYLFVSSSLSASLLAYNQGPYPRPRQAIDRQNRFELGFAASTSGWKGKDFCSGLYDFEG